MVDGQPNRPNRRSITALQARSLPEEPPANACVGKLDVGENLALRNVDRAPPSKGSRLSGAAMKAQALAGIAALKVRAHGSAVTIGCAMAGEIKEVA